MSVTIDDVLYTKIENYEACVGKKDSHENAVSRSKEGIIKIPSSVLISGSYYTVTMIGQGAFYCCEKITGIIIPNTVKTLKYECLECLYLKEHLIIPRSVTKIESNFLDSWYSKALIFCGTKEPELVKYKHEGSWISALFTGNVIVPKNYEKDTFCLKNVAKTATKEC